VLTLSTTGICWKRGEINLINKPRFNKSFQWNAVSILYTAFAQIDKAPKQASAILIAAFWPLPKVNF
jgi:hypothetical protein